MKTLSAALLVAATVSGGAAELPTVSGGSFSTSDFLARSPGVLVFWNSWLPRSKEFAALVPEVEAAARKHSWPGAVVIFQDQNREVADRLPGGMVDFPLVLDRRGELVRRFKVTRAPTVLLVNPDGSVRARSGPEPAEVRRLLQGMASR